MRKIVNAVAAGALLAGGLAAATPASAYNQTVVINNLRKFTPTCRAHPNYPVLARIAGRIGFSNDQSLNYEGCFPDVASCEAWLRRASGQFGGRIFIAVCEARR